MTHSQIFGALGGIGALAAYGLYFRQMIKGQSTPNPISWGIFFLAGLINALTYLTVVKGNLWQSLYIIVITSCLFFVLLYSTIKGRFAKIKTLDLILFILAISIGVFWQITHNARLSNLLLQSIYVIGYIPTYLGIIRKSAKEEYQAWLVAVIAYTLASFALVFDWPTDWIAFVNPVLNGIIGNGIVVILILIVKNSNPQNIDLKVARKSDKLDINNFENEKK